MNISFADSLITRGIRDQDSIDRKVAIRAYNTFAAMVVLIFTAYSIFYFWAGGVILGLNTVACAIASLLVHVGFRVEKHFTLMRALTTLIVLYSITSGIAMLGMGHGLEICYLTLTAVLPVVFDHSEKKWIHAGVGVTILCYIALCFLDLHWDAATDGFRETGMMGDVYRDVNFFTTIFVITYSLMILKNQQIIIQLELDEQRARMAHANRLASLGEMAGGIAHEINNPLAVIAASTEQIMQRQKQGLLEPEFLEKSLERSVKMTRRISAIVLGMRKLARGESEESNRDELVSDLFDEMSSLSAERLKHKEIKFETQMPPFPVAIHCKPDQLLQVMTNLLNNSIDAIEQLPERWIVLACTVQTHSIEISVTDSGPGIPSKIAAKVFNPFFTTKPSDKGTGLGLSISRGIMMKFGGQLEIDPSCEHTRFVMTFPRSETLSRVS